MSDSLEADIPPKTGDMIFLEGDTKEDDIKLSITILKNIDPNDAVLVYDYRERVEHRYLIRGNLLETQEIF